MQEDPQGVAVILHNIARRGLGRAIRKAGRRGVITPPRSCLAQIRLARAVRCLSGIDVVATLANGYQDAGGDLVWTRSIFEGRTEVALHTEALEDALEDLIRRLAG